MVENLEKIRPALTALEVGDAVVFPISRLKRFKTKTNRENQTITVSRIS